MMWVGIIGIPGRAALVINPFRGELYDDVGYVAFHLEVVDCGYIGWLSLAASLASLWRASR